MSGAIFGRSMAGFLGFNVKYQKILTFFILRKNFGVLGKISYCLRHKMTIYSKESGNFYGLKPLKFGISGNLPGQNLYKLGHFLAFFAKYLAL